MTTVNTADTGTAGKGKTSSELKALARGAIIGSLTVCVGANLLYGSFGLILDYIVGGVITGSGAASFALNIAFTFLVTLMMGIFQAGLSLIYLKKTFGQEASIADLFFGFRESPDRIIKLQAVLGAIQIAAALPAQI